MSKALILAIERSLKIAKKELAVATKTKATTMKKTKRSKATTAKKRKAVGGTKRKVRKTPRRTVATRPFKAKRRKAA